MSTAARRTVLRTTELSVSYGRTRVLHEVSLDVAENEAVAVLGPNGAGKSTLLAALMGCRRIVGGRIELDGRDLDRRGVRRAARAGLAIVPEGRRVFPSLSVAHNLELGAWARPAGSRETSDDVEAVYDRFPALRQRRDQPAGVLSGGEAQMLSLGIALMSRPRVLMLDEPSFGLAPVVVDAVYEQLASLRAGGMSVLLVEQDASRIASFAERVYVLQRGRVVATGGTELAEDTAALSSAYLGTLPGAHGTGPR
jgi:branched-chain amino acid transport system ATP-binding protein